MKALLRNTFQLGGYTFYLESAIYARQHEAVWLWKLNYHKISVTFAEEIGTPEQPEQLEHVLEIQTSKSAGVIPAVVSALQLYGFVSSVLSALSQVLTVLLDFTSLVPKAIEALTNAIQKILVDIANGQEPFDLTPYDNTLFVLELVRSGAVRDRRRPRWRKKASSNVE